MTLLVVEDDPVALDGLSLFFRACGAHVVEARTCARAASIIDTLSSVDVLLSALSQASSNGVELVAKLRQHASPYQPRAIGVSDDYDRHIDVSGFDMFIHKPLKFDEVCKVALALAESRRPSLL